MADKQPIVIQRGSFVCTIYDVENLMALPLANVRKLWKIMFSAEQENRDTIKTIREWLPSLVKDCEGHIQQAKAELKEAKITAANRHSEHARMGDGYWSKRVAALKAALKKKNADVENLTRMLESATALRDAPKLADRAVKEAQSGLASAKAFAEKAQKLQTIFNDFHKN